MARNHRKLTVILSADVAGFSRLMEADEAATVQALRDCQQVFHEWIERSRGRVIEATGDAILAEFPSAVVAVDCAVRLQAELARRQQTEPPARRMLHRIGINLGEVLDDGKSLFGDGVNVAARLEALAEPGGICVSGKVFDEIAGKLNIEFESIGEQRLKNIQKPVRTYRHHAAPPLSVGVLGELELRRGERLLELPQSRKTRALLAYLVVTARAVRRDRLCAIFWDVADDPRAALRWSLSKLRPVVDEPAISRIETTGALVRFDATGARVDLFDARNELDRLEEISSAEQLGGIVARFRGPFLDGLDLPDFLEFQSWLGSLREECRLLHARALRALVLCLAETPETALPHARDLVAVDGLDESSHEVLLRTLVACGRRREAEQHASAAVQLLRRVNPAAETSLTAALRQAVLTTPAGVATLHSEATAPASPLAASTRIDPTPQGQDTAVESARSTGTPIARVAAPAATPSESRTADRDLVGRRHEWARITAALDASMKEARLRALLLLGEPGIGKSYLLGVLLGEAERRRAAVLSGSAYEVEASRPYGPWIDALARVPTAAIGEALATELAPLLPQRVPLGGESRSRERLFGAVVELVAARAHSAPPVVIALDDVQWCDEASAELLHYVARMSRHRAVLITLAARSGELQDNDAMQRALRSLHRDGVFEEIELGALSEEETLRLTEGVAPPAQRDRVFAESAGNPLFALEVARSLPHRRESVPSTLRRLVRDRVDRLPVDAAEILRWAAVIGPTVDVRRLSEIAAIEPDRLVVALADLERFAMLQAVPALRGRAGSYAFAHDIVRQVVHAELSEPRRRLMHLRIVDGLRERAAADDALAADLAHHAGHAGEHDVAARACLRAARRCLRMFGGAEANGLARQGMHHAQQLADPDRVRLLLELAEARYGAHRPRDPKAAAGAVESLARQAVELGCMEHARLGFHIAGYLRWEGGDWSDAQRHLLRAEELSRTTEGRDRIDALGEAARCLALLERDLGQAEALVLEAKALGAGAESESASIADAVGMLRLHEGKLDEASEEFARARELCRRDQDHFGEFRTLEHLVMVALSRGRFRQAKALCEDLLGIASRLREGSEEPQAQALAALSGYGAGDGADGLERAISALRAVDAKQRLTYALRIAAEIDLARGAGEQAAKHAREAVDLARSLARPSDVVLARVALARAAELAGDPETAERERASLGAGLLIGVSSQARSAVRDLLAQRTSALPGLPQLKERP